MEFRHSNRRNDALTLAELLVILLIIAVRGASVPAGLGVFQEIANFHIQNLSGGTDTGGSLGFR